MLKRPYVSADSRKLFMPTHASIVIPNDVMQAILSGTISLAKCHPWKLFKARMTSAKITSDWSSMKMWAPVLSLTLEHSSGLQLTHRPTCKQFATFLQGQKPPIVWCVSWRPPECSSMRLKTGAHIFIDDQSDVTKDVKLCVAGDLRDLPLRRTCALPHLESS